MTKQECKNKMILLWEYLEKNPNRSKHSAYYKLGLDQDSWSCPCCVYASDPKGTKDCARCLLLDFWPKGSEIPCLHLESAYFLWRSCGFGQKSKYAGQIAQAAREIKI